jgi:hypothetical protein
MGGFNPPGNRFPTDILNVNPNNPLAPEYMLGTGAAVAHSTYKRGEIPDLRNIALQYGVTYSVNWLREVMELITGENPIAKDFAGCLLADYLVGRYFYGAYNRLDMENIGNLLTKAAVRTAGMTVGRMYNTSISK